MVDKIRGQSARRVQHVRRQSPPSTSASDAQESSPSVSVVEERLRCTVRQKTSAMLLAVGREPGAVPVQLIAEPRDERIKLLVRVDGDPLSMQERPGLPIGDRRRPGVV
jgi:hypothetical protein